MILVPVLVVVLKGQLMIAVQATVFAVAVDAIVLLAE